MVRLQHVDYANDSLKFNLIACQIRGECYVGLMEFRTGARSDGYVIICA